MHLEARETGGTEIRIIFALCTLSPTHKTFFIIREGATRTVFDTGAGEMVELEARVYLAFHTLCRRVHTLNTVSVTELTLLSLHIEV